MKGYWDNLRPFEKRVVVGVAAMVFLVMNVWFVFPHFSDWGSVQGRMAKARKALAAFQLEIGQMPHYKTNIASLENSGLAVPPENQAVEFSRTILAQQAQSAVSITTAQKPTTRTNEFFLELTERISVQSAEPQLVDFLYNLGSSNSLIRVRDLGLRPDAPRYQLSANVTLVASYQKNPARTAPPTTPTTANKSGKAAAKSIDATARPASPVVRTATPTNKPSAPASKPATATSKRP